jgi:hypothetical protein
MESAGNKNRGHRAARGDYTKMPVTAQVFALPSLRGLFLAEDRSSAALLAGAVAPPGIKHAEIDFSLVETGGCHALRARNDVSSYKYRF